MKRSILLLLAAALVLTALAGCGAPAPNPDATPKPTESAAPEQPPVGVQGNKPDAPAEPDKPSEEKPSKPEDANKEEPKGKSWYLVVNDRASGQITNSRVVIPVEVYFVLLMKNSASAEGAQGNFIGSCYQEFIADMGKLTVDGNVEATGFQNTYSFAYNFSLPISQLGANVNNTEYSGQGAISLINLRDVSITPTRDPSKHLEYSEYISFPQSVKIRAYPGSTDAKGMDVTVTFTDPDMTICGFPPLMGKLFSSDEMSDDEFHDMMDQLDKQMEKSREDMNEDESNENPKDTQAQAIEALQSQIKALESLIKDHESDDPSKYTKQEWENREKTYKDRLLEVAGKKEQLATLRK